MPLDTNARLQLSKTDPNLISYVFGSGEIEPEDSYLHQKFGGDYGKYEEMLIDPQVGGKLQERVGAVLGRSVIVDSITKSERDVEAANIAQRIIDRSLIPYEQICGDFLFSGLLCGFSVLAVNGTRQVTDKGTDENEPDIQLLLPLLEFVPQRRFTFRYHEPDKTDVPVCNDEKLNPKEDIVLVKGYELRLLTKRAPTHGERCPRDRFFVFTYGGIKGTPQGYGLGARLRKFFEIRSECIKSGVLTADRLGSPPVHGTYPDTLDPEDPKHAALINAFDRLLRAISPNANASTTDGFKINFLEPRAGGHQILNWLYSTATAEIANAIWGDRSYAEKETGSYAAQEAQNASRNENITDGDCNSLDEQLGNQLWRWIGDKNYKDANYPHIRRETASERRKLQQEIEEENLRGQRISNDRTVIIDLGATIDDAALKRRYGEDFSLPAEELPPEEAPLEPEAAEEPADAVEAEIEAAINEPLAEEVELAEVNFAANVHHYIDWNDYRIGVRHLPGETRFPQFRSAKKLQNGYGFVQGTRINGKASRCYIHPDLLEGKKTGGVFEITQLSPRTGEVDEIKLAVGYPSLESAELAYRREMPEAFFGGIRAIEAADLEEYADFAEGVKLTDLERNSEGQYKYQGEWWTLNKPKPAPKGSTKKKRVLASKVVNGVTYVKLVSFGHRDYDHNYSKDARKNYLKRSAGITDKAGNPTASDRHSPNYWSRRELWDAAEPTEAGLIEFAETKSRFTDEALHQQAVAEAKRKFRIYPSAYSSSYIVKKYKELYKTKHGSSDGAFSGDKTEGLSKWYKEDWVRISSTGKILGACGERTEREGKPKCLPRSKAESMTQAERAAAVRKKRKDDPNPNREGNPKHITTHAEPDTEPDPLDHYEERLVDSLGQAYGESLAIIQKRIQEIAASDASDEEKYRAFADGLYDLYSEMNPNAIASVLGEGLGLGYLTGMYSERVDRDDFDAAVK